MARRDGRQRSKILVVPAKAGTHTLFTIDGARRMGPGSRKMLARDDDKFSHRPALLSIVDDGFFQIEIALDPPPRFVGDLTFPQ